MTVQDWGSHRDGKIQVFCNATMCQLVNSFWSFEWVWCLWNISNYLPANTMQHPRQPECPITTLPREQPWISQELTFNEISAHVYIMTQFTISGLLMQFYWDQQGKSLKFYFMSPSNGDYYF